MPTFPSRPGPATLPTIAALAAFALAAFALAAFALVAFAPVPAAADRVHLKGGGVLEGRVERLPDGFQVQLASGALIVLPAADVDRIEEGETALDELDVRRATLDPTDVDGYYALALWCLDRGLERQAGDCFRHIVTVVPDHAAAREALGEVRFGDEWVPWDEALRRRGQVKHEGRWMSVEERDRLIFEARSRGIAREVTRLAARLRSGLPATRAAAAKALIALGKDADPAAFEPLLEAVRHWNPEVRIAAAFAVAPYAPREERAQIALVDLASRDPVLAVQDAAIDALKPLKLVAVGERLVDEYLFAPQASVRNAAAHALGQLRYKGAVAAFIETLFFRVVKNQLVPVGFEPYRLRLVGDRRFAGYYNYELVGGPSPHGGLGYRRYEYRLVRDYAFNGAAKEALKGITGRDFDFDREAWRNYWDEARDRHGPFMEEVDPPAGSAPPPPG